MVLKFSVAAWNIRGLNFHPKQKEVQEVVSSNSLSICAVLESHVLLPKLQKICSSVFGGWNGCLIISKGLEVHGLLLDGT